MKKVPPRSLKVSHGRNPASAGSSGNPVVASSARHDPLLTVVGVGFAEMKRSGEPLNWTESWFIGTAWSQA
jgi:hypothetical protein